MEMESTSTEACLMVPPGSENKRVTLGLAKAYKCGASRVHAIVSALKWSSSTCNFHNPPPFLPLTVYGHIHHIRDLDTRLHISNFLVCTEKIYI